MKKLPSAGWLVVALAATACTPWPAMTASGPGAIAMGEARPSPRPTGPAGGDRIRPGIGGMEADETDSSPPQGSEGVGPGDRTAEATPSEQPQGATVIPVIHL